jgi:hypothetical protein
LLVLGKNLPNFGYDKIEKKRKKEGNPDDKLMAIKQFYLKYRNHIVP